SGSLVSKGIASLLSNYFKLKQYLRDKRIHEKFHRMVFKLKSENSTVDNNFKYEFIEISDDFKKQNLVEIDFNSEPNSHLKLIVFDFLYLNTECISDIKIHEIIDKKRAFVLSGKEKKIEIQLK